MRMLKKPEADLHCLVPGVCNCALPIGRTSFGNDKGLDSALANGRDEGEMGWEGLSRNI